jgi:hypothetical protein
MAKAPPAPVPAPAVQPTPVAAANLSHFADPRARNPLNPPLQPTFPAAPAHIQPAPAAVPNQLAALAALLPQANSYSPNLNNLIDETRQPTAPAIDPQKLTLIQLLLSQGVSVEQIATLLNTPAATAQPQTTQPHPPTAFAHSPEVRSRSRSPPRGRGRISPSISPPRNRGRGRRRDSFDSPSRRRRSPSYDDYRRPPSRSRSPPPRRRSPPPVRERSPLRSPLRSRPPPVVDEKDYKPRFLEWDDSLKPDRIRGIVFYFCLYDWTLTV